MNNLPTTLNLPDTLPAYAVEWVGAKFNELPFNKLGKEAQYRGCLDIITIAHADDGNKGGTNSETLVFQTQALIGELSGKFGILTLKEIQRAFKMGIRGEFGEYFGLCAKTYHSFLKGYSTHPDRIRAQNEYLELVEKSSVPTSTKPIGQKLAESKEGCMRVFKEYKQSKTLPYCAHAYYSVIKELGLVNWTKEERLEITAQAEVEYKQKLKEDRANRIISQNQYMEILENLVGDQNKSLINVAKKIALKRYFDSIDKLEI